MHNHQQVGHITVGDGKNKDKIEYRIIQDTDECVRPYSICVGTKWVSICILPDLTYDDAMTYLTVFEGILKHVYVNNLKVGVFNLDTVKYLKNQYTKMPLPKVCSCT